MGFFEDIIRDNPAFSLEDALYVIWDDYPADFSAYWGLDDREPPDHLDEDDWREYQRLDRLVTRLANGAHLLVRPVKTPDADLSLHEWLKEEAGLAEEQWERWLDEWRQSLAEDQWWQLFRLSRPSAPGDPRLKKRFMHARMETEAERLYPYSPGKMASRLFRLLQHVVLKPGQKTREYLPRLAECYVRGMDIELAVMARTVLDAALQDEYSDEDVRNEVGAGKDVVLERRIQCAASAGPFRPRNILDAADRIRKTGNRAAHADLSVAVDADSLLEDVTTCLEALDEGG